MKSYLKTVDVEKFYSISGHYDHKRLLEEILKLRTAANFLDNTVNNTYRNSLSDDPSESDIKAQKEHFIEVITIVLWHPDQYSEEYRVAYKELSPACWLIDGLRDINSIL